MFCYKFFFVLVKNDIQTYFIEEKKIYDLNY